MTCYEQLDDLAILALNLCVSNKWQHNLSIICQTSSVFLRLYQKRLCKYFLYLRNIISVTLIFLHQ